MPIHYGKGARDFAFVAYYTIFLTFTREFIMEKVLQPLAVASGLQRRSKQARFKEQVYTAMYHGGMSIYGFYVMTKTPLWYFDTKAMFDSYPHRTHMATFKAFYLLQASYWAQQMLVMIAGLEKPRKDFKELVAHHIITLSLIWLSYRFHFTYVGLGVFITHDASDFFFAVWMAKPVFPICALTLGFAADVQNPQLPRFPLSRALLRCFHRRLDIYAALPQSAYSHDFPPSATSWSLKVGELNPAPLGVSLKYKVLYSSPFPKLDSTICGSRPERAELGNATLQILGQPVDWFYPSRYSPGAQSFLAVSDLPRRIPIHL